MATAVTEVSVYTEITHCSAAYRFMEVSCVTGTSGAAFEPELLPTPPPGPLGRRRLMAGLGSAVMFIMVVGVGVGCAGTSR